ncbi:MAG: hypothetical protein SCK57_12420 [Bacillota bacterium]|nr:hypothetical protein [Bacillota bacterium]MDW7678456.1 hypothetical protein [Bacillota bacterium]
MLQANAIKRPMHKAIRYSVMDNFIFLLFSLYFILSPFYFWSSGLPQVADFIIIFLVFVYAIKKQFRFGIPTESRQFLLTGLFFVGYVLAANLTWMMILNGSISFIRTSAFYIYNFLVAVMVVGLYSEYKEKIIEVTYKATLVSVLIQAALFIAGGGYTGGRMTGGFNNPNQLGYYAIMVASIMIFASSRIRIKAGWFVLGIFSAALLVLASLSSTAIVSFAGLVIFFLVSKLPNKKFKRNVNLIIIALFLVMTFIYQNMLITLDSPIIRGLQNRVMASEGKLTSFSFERGYYRIIEYPEYWILGAGEGANVERFRASGEFHSTLGNIQVSYGIIGLVLFLRYMYLALKKDGFQSWYIIAFILAYGLTHNGIRNSMLWILIALIVSSPPRLFVRVNSRPLP